MGCLLVASHAVRDSSDPGDGFAIWSQRAVDPAVVAEGVFLVDLEHREQRAFRSGFVAFAIRTGDGFGKAVILFGSLCMSSSLACAADPLIFISAFASGDKAGIHAFTFDSNSG